jgi:hypothetical protein
VATPTRGSAAGPPPPFSPRATLILIIALLAAAAGCALTIMAGHTLPEGLLVAGSAGGGAASLAHRFISL